MTRIPRVLLLIAIRKWGKYWFNGFCIDWFTDGERKRSGPLIYLHAVHTRMCCSSFTSGSTGVFRKWGFGFCSLYWHSDPAAKYCTVTEYVRHSLWYRYFLHGHFVCCVAFYRSSRCSECNLAVFGWYLHTDIWHLYAFTIFLLNSTGWLRWRKCLIQFLYISLYSIK